MDHAVSNPNLVGAAGRKPKKKSGYDSETILNLYIHKTYFKLKKKKKKMAKGQILYS